MCHSAQARFRQPCAADPSPEPRAPQVGAGRSAVAKGDWWISSVRSGVLDRHVLSVACPQLRQLPLSIRGMRS